MLDMLDRLLALAEQATRIHSVIEILTLRALAWQAQGEVHAALTDLERALALAAPEGYVRSFVDEGVSMATLLAQIVARESTVATYAEGLLGAFPKTNAQGVRTESHAAFNPQSSDLVEPLSRRELEILRLIAAGHSNQAIADTLIVAVSTVKKHINNIYSKLAVQSRTQALAHARQLNLL
jgi:LuxR family maltose regulon positive regulatory protein